MSRVANVAKRPVEKDPTGETGGEGNHSAGSRNQLYDPPLRASLPQIKRNLASRRLMECSENSRLRPSRSAWRVTPWDLGRRRKRKRGEPGLSPATEPARFASASDPLGEA